MPQVTAVDLGDLDRFRAALAAAPTAAARAIQAAAHDIAAEVASFIREAAPEFQGDLRSSIEGDVSHATVAAGGTVEAVVTAGVPYALVQDVGRRPGKWPPEAPIRRWVELRANRLGAPLSPHDLDRLTFLVRRAIGEGRSRHQRNPSRYIERGLDKARPRIEARLAQLEVELAAICTGGTT